MPPQDPADEPALAADAVHLTTELLVQTQHKLRTPLAAIIGHAQLLRRRLDRETDLPDEHRTRVERHAAAIESCARTLADAIDRLADPQQARDDA